MTMRHNLAVMAQRAEPADSLDFFPTPPWATRAFMAHMDRRHRVMMPRHVLGDPCCGQGHMAGVLREFTRNPVIASDIHDYGYGEVSDFLDDGEKPAVDWWIFNPPFRLAQRFAEVALEHPAAKARIGVAMLVRLSWLESAQRHGLFARRRPALIVVHADRVPMHRGRWIVNGTSATAYAWVVWQQDDLPLGMNGGISTAWRCTAVEWLPPGAKAHFHRDEDVARFGGEFKRRGEQWDDDDAAD